MKTVPEKILRTGCKINLTLYIQERMPNGLHTLQSLMYPLACPGDRLRCGPGSKPGKLTVLCPADPVLEQEHNILYRIWGSLEKRVGQLPAVEVFLEKNVPQGAGLGGGSANAAGFLKYILALPHLPEISPEECLEIASEAGSDVPFFFSGVPALVSGFGEKIAPLPVRLDESYVLLVCPPQAVSTAWAYACWDAMTLEESRLKPSLDSPRAPGAQSLTSRPPAYNNPETHTGTVVLFNSFEEPVFSAYPRLRCLKEELLQRGASGALMSGSGSTLFGLFRAEQPCAEAAKAFQQQGNQVFMQKLKTTGVSPSW